MKKWIYFMIGGLIIVVLIFCIQKLLHFPDLFAGYFIGWLLKTYYNFLSENYE
jgi:hypothetical protein